MKNYITNIIACSSVVMAAFFGCISLEQSKELEVKQETIAKLDKEISSQNRRIWKLVEKVEALDESYQMAAESSLNCNVYLSKLANNK